MFSQHNPDVSHSRQHSKMIVSTPRRRIKQMQHLEKKNKVDSTGVAGAVATTSDEKGHGGGDVEKENIVSSSSIVEEKSTKLELKDSRSFALLARPVHLTKLEALAEINLKWSKMPSGSDRKTKVRFAPIDHLVTGVHNFPDLREESLAIPPIEIGTKDKEDFDEFEWDFDIEESQGDFDTEEGRGDFGIEESQGDFEAEDHTSKMEIVDIADLTQLELVVNVAGDGDKCGTFLKLDNVGVDVAAEPQPLTEGHEIGVKETDKKSKPCLLEFFLLCFGIRSKSEE